MFFQANGKRHKMARPAAQMNKSRGGDRRRWRNRSGVILLVVMALLTLFTLLGLTLVLATAQSRLSALNSARAQRSGTPPQQLLSRAFLDVARGSTNSRSPVQAHGLLEDLYGAPLFIGQVSSAPVTLGAGQLVQIAYSTLSTLPSNSPPYLAPNASYVFTGLVVTMRDGVAANRSARIVADRSLGDYAAGYQLITTLFGGTESSNGGQAMPQIGDTFVINGRPFSGTGAGFQLASFNSVSAPFLAGNTIYGGTLALPVLTSQLDAVDPTPFLSSVAQGLPVPMNSAAPQFLWPYALLPNNAHFTPQNPNLSNPASPLFIPLGGLPQGGGWYTDPGGPGVMTLYGANYAVAPGATAAPGGANEPYDAVDYQNMFLAMHYFDTNVLPVANLTMLGTPWPATLTHPDTLTPVPSYHRPELIAYWSQQLPGSMGMSSYTALSAFTTLQAEVFAELRRKVLLRPNPADQVPGPSNSVPYPLTLDLNGNGVYDFREPFTDVNGNGYWDASVPPNSLPEPFLDLNGDLTYTAGDIDFTGKRFNPITGPYCVYHDPTTNLDMWVRENPNPNFPGPTGDWDVDNDNDGYSDSIWLDLGYDPEPGADGRLYKPLFAILCVDMDGKLNLNAHGMTAHLDSIRYGGAVTGPFAEGGGVASGSLATLNATLSRNFTFGEGAGPAEISLLPVLQRLYAAQVMTNVPPNYALQYYQELLQGTYLPTNGANASKYINGRYGEVDDPFLSLAPSVASVAFSPAAIIGGPQAGRTLQFDPLTTFVNDPLNQARQFLDRPFLLAPAAAQPPLFPNNSLGIFFDFIFPNFQTTSYMHVPTGSSNPYNLYGRGAPLLDLRGQPYYAGTSFLPWNSVITNPNNNIQINDTVDDPYELDLSLTPQQSGMIVTAAGNVSQIDSPFKPEELERVLRSSDVDAQALSSRLNDLIPLNPAPLQPNQLSLARPERRHAVTTDSYDLPVPGVTAVDLQQQADLNTSLYHNTIYNTTPTSLGGKSIVDMARARIMARNGWTYAQADLALFGNMMMGLSSAYKPQVEPLLAPELIEGMRIDINRAVGNAIDDNGNGAVDEPTEVTVPTEALLFPLANGASVAISLDLNNDGILPGGDPYFYSDARARQLLARHLYVTMMLLIDDLNLQVQIFEPASPTLPFPNAPQYSTLTTQFTGNRPAQQLAYFVAQWAINVVDFRDPDSIMTPFEFDMSPFTDDDPAPGGYGPLNGTWDVDGIVMPTLGVTIDPWTGMQLNGYTSLDDMNPAASLFRGVVWGCERPELLLTETMAFHDRGTADTNQATALAGGGQDTYVNTGGPPFDTTYDQIRRPRGSIVVELFNPNSPLSAPQGDMLQMQPPGTQIPNTGGVNLTQFTTNPTTGLISPVWRLAVTYSAAGYDAYTKTAPAGMLPLDPRVPIIPANYIHRVAYFTPMQPTQNGVLEVPQTRSFFPDPTIVPPGANVVVPPNSYAIIAPGAIDTRANSPLPGVAALFFGARNNSGDNTAGPNGKQNNYHNYLQLNPFGPAAIGMYNNFGAGATGGVGAAMLPFVATTPQANIKNVVALPLATLYFNGALVQLASTAPPPTTSTSLRFSLSEPEAGYPLMSTLTGPNVYWDDGFYFLSGSGTGQYPNTPFDDPANTNGVTPNPNVSPDGTILNYTTIYLQRLANPLAQWDAIANPYIIVDSMPLDLTSYTGENLNPPAASLPTKTEPSYGGTSTATSMAFDARSRGLTTAADLPNIWTTTSTPPNAWGTSSTPGSPQSVSPTNTLPPLQYSSFGFLNQTYWVSSAGLSTGTTPNVSPGFTTTNNWYAGFYSSACTDGPALQRLQTTTSQVSYSGVNMQASQYYGDPILPFPWLVWNNRPFVSQYELMLVPSSSPSSLVGDFGLLGYAHTNYYTATGTNADQWTPYNTGYSPYNPLAGVEPINSTGTPATLAVPLGPFQHLLNFYDSTITNATLNTTRNDTNVASPANFFRIFEYLNTPSPYSGTQNLLNPAAMSGTVSGLHWLHPPFNWQSQYRDPGRINLNTVFDPVVFQGLMDDYPQWQYSVSPATSWQTLWQGLVDTRRGYSVAGYNSVTGLSAAQAPGIASSSMLPNYSLFTPAALPLYPTYFANPFRPDGAGLFEPPVRTAVYPAATMQQPPGQSINTTMLRAAGVAAYPGMQVTGTTPAPLFAATTFDNANQKATYVSPSTGAGSTSGTAPWRQAARNAYFQYQAQQRLGNLVTNRSNVYAVWVTVGYFEALPVLPSAANPDGFQLGQEKGSETGAIERHRAFYMFDRSIPMGFQRGEDLNVQDGMLVERMIE